VKKYPTGNNHILSTLKQTAISTYKKPPNPTNQMVLNSSIIPYYAMIL